MNEHEIQKDHMDALKALSDTNLKVSEAQNALFALQETETEYLLSREKTALTRIEKVLEESKEVIAQTHKNYAEVQQFHRTVSDLADFVSKASEEFGNLVKSWDEKSELNEQLLKEQEKELAEQKKALLIDKNQIENEKKNILHEKENIKTAHKKLADERGTLERAVTRLKEGRI